MSARLYFTGLTIAAVGLSWLGWTQVPLGTDEIWPLVALCVMGAIGATSGEKKVSERASFNFGSIILVAAMAIVGPFGAAVVGLCTYLFEWGRRPHIVRYFNAVMMAVVGALGGLVYWGLWGYCKPDAAQTALAHTVADSGVAVESLLHIGLPLIAADVVTCLANAVLLGGIVRLTDGTPLRRFVTGMLSTTGPGYVGYGVIGFLFVILWWPARLDLASCLLILPPLFVARWAFVQYGDEQRAHERTLSALVTAVEVKDVYTRGHSERVAQLCNQMASALSLSHQETEALRYVGLLHDIGKLGIPTKVLRKTEEMTDEDLATIAQHPARGVDMLRDISFLRESFDGILHHHERFDGRGYPVGLAGEEIPLSARIVAVADAFDSLTTSRAHRGAYPVDRALAELHRRGGSQLDPAMVGALERALTRQTFQPAEPDLSLPYANGRAFDHDDPEASDLMADRFEALRRRPGGPQRRMPP